MSAVNYARHAHGHYVFLAAGERPDPAWLHPNWAWWEEPAGEFARKIGDTLDSACMRTEHGTRSCSRCRAQIEGRRLADIDKRFGGRQ